MLVLSRVEQGLSVETEPARLNRLVEETMEEFQQRSRQREVRFDSPSGTSLVSV